VADCAHNIVLRDTAYKLPTSPATWSCRECGVAFRLSPTIKEILEKAKRTDRESQPHD